MGKKKDGKLSIFYNYKVHELVESYDHTNLVVKQSISKNAKVAKKSRHCNLKIQRLINDLKGVEEMVKR